MITVDEFAQLKLTDFLEPDEIEERDNWEFVDEEWEGEAYIFTEFLRRKSSPRQLARTMSMS